MFRRFRRGGSRLALRCPPVAAARVAPERRRQGVCVESLEEVVIAAWQGDRPLSIPNSRSASGRSRQPQRQIALRSFAPASIAARAIPRTDLSSYCRPCQKISASTLRPRVSAALSDLQGRGAGSSRSAGAPASGWPNGAVPKHVYPPSRTACRGASTRCPPGRVRRRSGTCAHCPPRPCARKRSAPVLRCG